MAGKSPTMTTTAAAQTTTTIKRPTNIDFTITELCFAHLTLAELRTRLDDGISYQARRRRNLDQKASTQRKLDSVLVTLR